MKILSISTATNQLSVALNEDQRVITEKNERDERNHSEHLDPLIQEILTENKLTLKEIDRFAVAIGPGSYTGLRIGVTTVKMFASILHKELVGVSTLQALAAGALSDQDLVIAGIDARNDNYFAGAYIDQQEQAPICVIDDGHYHIDTLLAAIKKYHEDHPVKELVFVGSGFEKQQKLLEQLEISYRFGTQKQNEIHAGLIGQLALQEKPVDPDELLPKYLRRTQAEADWHQKTGKPFGSDRDYVEEV